MAKTKKKNRLRIHKRKKTHNCFSERHSWTNTKDNTMNPQPISKEKMRNEKIKSLILFLNLPATTRMKPSKTKYFSKCFKPINAHNDKIISTIYSLLYLLHPIYLYIKIYSLFHHQHHLFLSPLMLNWIFIFIPTRTNFISEVINSFFFSIKLKKQDLGLIIPFSGIDWFYFLRGLNSWKNLIYIFTKYW